MTAATRGDTVKVHYTLTLDQGQQVDTSRERDPLEVTIGQGQVIPGFEQALEGMGEGETRQVTVPAAQGYGARREELVQQIEPSQIPPEIDISVGQQLQAQDQQGRTMILTVVEATPEAVTVDGNHPLAGHDLNFDLEIVEIAKAA